MLLMLFLLLIEGLFIAIAMKYLMSWGESLLKSLFLLNVVLSVMLRALRVDIGLEQTLNMSLFFYSMTLPIMGILLQGPNAKKAFYMVYASALSLLFLMLVTMILGEAPVIFGAEGIVESYQALFKYTQQFSIPAFWGFIISQFLFFKMLKSSASKSILHWFVVPMIAAQTLNTLVLFPLNHGWAVLEWMVIERAVIGLGMKISLGLATIPLIQWAVSSSKKAVNKR